MGLAAVVNLVLKKQPPGGGTGAEGLGAPLRPVDDSDAGHTVLEAMGPQAGHIVIHDLHLAPTESWVLKQVQLVVWAILEAKCKGKWAPHPNQKELSHPIPLQETPQS